MRAQVHPIWCWAPTYRFLGWMQGTAGTDGPAPSHDGCCNQPAGPHALSWDLVVGRFQSRSNLCPKPSPIITFTESSAKKLHNLLMFSVKVLFFLFLLNLLLNNLRSLPDLLLLSYFTGVFCLFPLSVLCHHHLDLFSQHSLLILYTETVHKIYVCFTALGLQWRLFPYFRKSLNLAGKTW